MRCHISIPLFLSKLLPFDHIGGMAFFEVFFFFCVFELPELFPVVELLFDLELLL